MTWGLFVFIVVHILNFLGLVVDYMLYSLEWPTITYTVYHKPWLGFVIILPQVFALIGLVEHFYGNS